MTAAAVDAFSAGVGDAMVVTGVVGLVATVVVALLWPRRAGGQLER